MRLLGTLHTISQTSLLESSLLLEALALCLLLITLGRARIEHHRIGTHKDRIALLKVVADCRRIEGQHRIALLLPILATIAESNHFVLLVVELNIMTKKTISPITVVIEAIAPHLLILGQDVAILGNHIDLSILLVASSVGIEILTLVVPDIGMCKELSSVGIDMVYHRVAHHLILVIGHLHLVDTDNLVLVGIEVTPIRLEDIITLSHHTSVREDTDALERIKFKFIGIEGHITIHNLHQL